jgi:hypothetical protein
MWHALENKTGHYCHGQAQAELTVGFLFQGQPGKSGSVICTISLPSLKVMLSAEQVLPTPIFEVLLADTGNKTVEVKAMSTDS